MSAENHKDQFAEAQLEKIEGSWSGALASMNERYAGTLIGDPTKGFLALRTEGQTPNFYDVFKDMAPFNGSDLLFTKYGPVIAWISPQFVEFEKRTEYWQKPEVQEAVLKYARSKLKASIVKGPTRYEHEMWIQDTMTLPGFKDAAGKDRAQNFLLVNPLDEKLGDACLRELEKQYKFHQEFEKASLEKSVAAAHSMATKFSTSPTQPTQS